MEEQRETDPEMRQTIQNTLGSSDEIVAAGSREYFESENSIVLNIAITGDTGVGKSSFVNAFREVDDSSDDAAPTGLETTTEVKEYPHPSYPNVIFSDLPGIGTPMFPPKRYFKLVDFGIFDFYIIISSNRFRENEIMLAKEIKKMGKKFYFIRSKVDNNLQAEKSKKDFNEEKTLTQIREDCVKGLKERGLETPKVFLLSNHDIDLYDFPLLRDTLEEELPEHKKHALLLASPCIFPDIINKKKKFFQRQMWYLTALSGVGAAVPVPGFSVAFDLSLLAGAVTQYVLGFGLNVPSLKKTATRTGIPYDELKVVLNFQLIPEVIIQHSIMKVAIQALGKALLMAAENMSRLSLIARILASATLSAFTTYKLLKLFLDFLAEDAQRLSDRVMKEKLCKKS